MTILGYLCALFVGLSLGAIGAGGSILAVPIFVYLLHVTPITATRYSLLVVGCTAFVGSLRYFKAHLINFKVAFAFSIPAMMAVVLTRTLIIPALPDAFLGITKDIFILALFACLMIASAVFMIRAKKNKPEKSERKEYSKLRYFWMFVGSAAIGFLIGLVGAGGGFLIIPGLILFFDLDAKQAIATSLLVITFNSFSGFMGDLMIQSKFDWITVGVFLAMTLFGVFIGTAIGKRTNESVLRKLFGYFTLLVGGSIMITELMKFYL